MEKEREDTSFVLGKQREGCHTLGEPVWRENRALVKNARGVKKEIFHHGNNGSGLPTENERDWLGGEEKASKLKFRGREDQHSGPSNLGGRGEENDRSNEGAGEERRKEKLSKNKRCHSKQKRRNACKG